MNHIFPISGTAALFTKVTLIHLQASYGLPVPHCGADPTSTAQISIHELESLNDIAVLTHFKSPFHAEHWALVTNTGFFIYFGWYTHSSFPFSISCAFSSVLQIRNMLTETLDSQSSPNKSRPRMRRSVH